MIIFNYVVCNKILKGGIHMKKLEIFRKPIPCFAGEGVMPNKGLQVLHSWRNGGYGDWSNSTASWKNSDGWSNSSASWKNEGSGRWSNSTQSWKNSGGWSNSTASWKNSGGWSNSSSSGK